MDVVSLEKFQSADPHDWNFSNARQVGRRNQGTKIVVSEALAEFARHLPRCTRCV
jgi:hypothetical protein